MNDPQNAPLTLADKALVAFAEKLTRAPNSVSENDLNELRKVEFSDRAIHDTVQVVALFNYYNRVADGLGVILDDDNL